MTFTAAHAIVTIIGLIYDKEEKKQNFSPYFLDSK